MDRVLAGKVDRRLETLLAELARVEPVTAGHWRTHDRDEVDCVMEFDDGRVLAFEVKASERVNSRDLKGLRTLRDALGDRFIAGVAFTTGARSYTHADRIHVMPVDRLWQPIP